MGLRKKINKQRGVKTSVRLKRSNKRLPVPKEKIFGDQDYHQKKTLKENYQNMGIQLNPNRKAEEKKEETNFLKRIQDIKVVPDVKPLVIPFEHL